MNLDLSSVRVRMDVYNDGEMWCARGVGHDIFTQGKTLDELVRNIHEAVTLHFDDDVVAYDATPSG